METMLYKVEETGVDDTTDNITTMDTGDEAVVGSRVHGLRPRQATNYSRHTHGLSTSKKTGYTLTHMQ